MGDLTWLTKLGPSGLLALFLGLIIVGVWVPRWIWKREAERADRAEAAALATLQTVRELTAQVHLLVDLVAERRDVHGTARHRDGG